MGREALERVGMPKVQNKKANTSGQDSKETIQKEKLHFFELGEQISWQLMGTKLLGREKYFVKGIIILPISLITG